MRRRVSGVFASLLAHERDTASCRATAATVMPDEHGSGVDPREHRPAERPAEQLLGVGKRTHGNAARLGPPCLLNLEIKLVSIECENARPFKELPCENYAFPPI